MIDKIVKGILAVLFFLCLLNMPYGYYQLIRFVAFIGFIILGYQAKENNNYIETFIFVCLAILFQPLIKISLGRELWNVVDVFVGIGLIVSIFLKKRAS